MRRDAAIEARGLEKRFGEKRAVLPFAARVEPGCVTGLLGPNGSGKSTFMRMLTGLVKPDGGEAWIAGAQLKGDGTQIRRRVTYMPGETALYKELRGQEHLEWLLRGRDEVALERALAIAEGQELPLHKRVRTYSHGMKRLLLLAATLGPSVPVRILDEPTEGLDPTRRADVLDLLEREAREGVAILLSSHHLEAVDRTCDQLLFLNQGALLAKETAENLRVQAQHLIRIEWPEQVDAAAHAPMLCGIGALEVRPEGHRASIRLAESDPRAFLAALARIDALPPPQVVVYGKLSLRELYRDLYGVEGV